MSDAAQPSPQREAAARRELFAVLAHELRSPIGAILGFEELLSEGILGEVPPTSADALARIRSSALQLLDLVAGLNDLALEPGDAVEGTVSEVDGGVLVRQVLAALAHEAEGRGTVVEHVLPDTLPGLRIDAVRAARALQLAFMAAIKASAGGSLRIDANLADEALCVEVHGTRLDEHRDDPDISLQDEERARLTGAGLRIAMARRALSLLGGELRLHGRDGATTLTVRLPRAQR